MRHAGTLALSLRANLTREDKPDGSIVTNADREVELFLRNALSVLVPGSTFWGEEFGKDSAGTGGLWLIDPIDGTSNYFFGLPLWGVSVALLQGESLVLGAVALPELDEWYLSTLGGGATCNGVQLPKIRPGGIESNDLMGYCDSLQKAYPGQKIPGKMRCCGAFVLSGAWTVKGTLRGCIGYREKFYDMAGSVALANELDLDVRYASGEKMPLDDLLQDQPIDQAWCILPKGCDFTL